MPVSGIVTIVAAESYGIGCVAIVARIREHDAKSSTTLAISVMLLCWNFTGKVGVHFASNISKKVQHETEDKHRGHGHRVTAGS